MKIINVAKDFSKFPFGRSDKHGPHNGERFMTEKLLPQLRAGKSLVVDFAGTDGLSPSFLEEAFGGLVRAGYSPAEIKRRVDIKFAEDPSMVLEAWSFVSDTALKGKAVPAHA